MRPNQPPASVLRAFGAPEPPVRLAGGQGGSWRAGHLVLKPDAGPVQGWLAPVLSTVVTDGFRLAVPARTRAGAWSCEGWSATAWVEGTPAAGPAAGTWVEVLDAGRAFHRAVCALGRPPVLDARDDRWALADRAAWGDGAADVHPRLAGLHRRLVKALRPLGAPQLVHADLTGNVLLAPGLPPAVIDVSPYWRPAAYAEGVVVADALCWHGAPASLVAAAGVPVAAVARALLFRLLTTSAAAAQSPGDVDVPDQARRYGLAAQALGL